MISQRCRLLGYFLSDQDEKSIELIRQDVGIPCILRTLARFIGESSTYGFPQGASITFVCNNLLCEVLSFFLSDRLFNLPPQVRKHFPVLMASALTRPLMKLIPCPYPFLDLSCDGWI